MGNDRSTVSGLKVLVTGGTTGIGRATAIKLAAEGADVMVVGRNEEPMKVALADIEKTASGKVFGVIADTSNHEDVLKIFEAVDSQLGGIDVLVNNAGVAGESIVETPYEEWAYVIGVNLTGYMDCAAEASRRMLPRGKGHIINVGSVSADSRDPEGDIYVATKAGIQGFTESLAKSLGAKGIKVTLIEPGLVGSDMTTDDMSKKEELEAIEDGEMLIAEDLADCVHYCIAQPWRSLVRSIQIGPVAGD